MLAREPEGYGAAGAGPKHPWGPSCQQHHRIQEALLHLIRASEPEFRHNEKTLNSTQPGQATFHPRFYLWWSRG